MIQRLGASLTLASLLFASIQVAPAKAQDLAPAPRTEDVLLRLFETDRPLKAPVKLQERTSSKRGQMFADLPEGFQLHPSYDATFELCQLFDPYNRSDAEVPDAAIDAYLKTLLDTPPILEAFHATGRATLEDLKKAWFRGGRGFEHVICGEKGKGNKLGGYHFWYMQYRYEREGRAWYTGSDYGQGNQDAGIKDSRIVTGGMAIDPDGEGGRAPLVKSPRGGFTVGHSVSAILAAGHIALYGTRSEVSRMNLFGTEEAPFAARLAANINGKTYPWTFHTVGWEGEASIRTFWPKWVPDGSRGFSEILD